MRPRLNETKRDWNRNANRRQSERDAELRRASERAAKANVAIEWREEPHVAVCVCVCVLSWVNYFVCVCVAWGAKTNCAHRIRFSIVPNMLEEGSSHILLSLCFSLTDLFRAVKNVFKSRRSNVVVACGGVQLDYF